MMRRRLYALAPSPACAEASRSVGSPAGNQCTSTGHALTGHWRHQIDALLEQARQAEEAVATAKGCMQELSRQQELQWEACRDRYAVVAIGARIGVWYSLYHCF